VARVIAAAIAVRPESVSADGSLRTEAESCRLAPQGVVERQDRLGRRVLGGQEDTAVGQLRAGVGRADDVLATVLDPDGRS
jgi:hypothetical protein